MSFSRWRSVACFLACALGACGPIGATNLIGDAEVALARAHAADAERLAPYETTLADLYLAKAREEQGHAKYADARDLAAECVRQANLAAKKAAERRARAPAPVPAPAPAANKPAGQAPAGNREAIPAAPLVPAPLVPAPPAPAPLRLAPVTPPAPADPRE